MIPQEQQTELLARLLDLSPTPMGACREGVLVFANPAFARLVGVDTAASLHRQPIERYLPGYRELAEAATRSPNQDHAPSFLPRLPCQTLTPSGKGCLTEAVVDASRWNSEGYLQFSLWPVPVGSPDCENCLNPCPTYDELRRRNCQLENVMEERTAELMAANHELESFSYSVSHDLRAPLRAINGFTKMLQDHCEGALDATASGYLQRVVGATHRMSALIDDLLRLSQVTRAGMRHEEVNLTALVHATAAGLQEPGRVALQVQPGMGVRGDPALLKVMLVNLLENAWKFSSRVDAPAVHVGAVHKGRWLECHVRDNGIGYDPAYAGRLFEPFQRLHSQQDFPGTGIGLATVRRVVERHGGRIWAESSPGAGATFTFTLPCG